MPPIRTSSNFPLGKMRTSSGSSKRRRIVSTGMSAIAFFSAPGAAPRRGHAPLTPARACPRTGPAPLSQLRAQLLDLLVQYAVVLGIIDRAIDQVDSGRAQAFGEDRRQAVCVLDAVADHAVTPRIGDEIRTAVG